MSERSCPDPLHVWRGADLALPNPDDICLCGKIMWGEGMSNEDKIILTDGRCEKCGWVWDDHPRRSCPLTIQARAR